MSLEELMNIKIITASKIKQKVSDVPASSIIITREEIEKHGYMTIDEIFQNIPGFYGIDDYGEGGMMFGVRGFWSGIPNSNIVIMINSIPQTKNVFSSHPLVQIQVPVASIERIEVVRGPMSVIYGSGAFYGAVNIITNDFKNSKPENTLSMGVGSSNTKKVFLQLKNNNKKFKLSANFSIYNTDGIDKPADQLMSDLDLLENYGLSADYTTGRSLGKKYKFFNLSAELDKLYFHFVLAETDTGNHFSFPPIGVGHKNTYSDLNLAIGYRNKINNKLSIDGKLTYYKDRAWFKYNFFHEDFFGIQQQESQALELTIDMFYNPSKKLKLQTGFFYKSIFDIYNLYHLPSFLDDFFINNIIDTGGDSINSMAFYTQLSYMPSKNLSFVTGVRIERSLPYEIHGGYSFETDVFNKKTGMINRNKIEIVPRFALIYKLAENNILKLLYGKAIKRPSFFQDAAQFPSGAATLLPEKIKTIELNYQTIFNNKYSISLNLFHNVLDNLITRIIILDSIGNYDYSFFSNAGRMITNGIEFSLDLKPLESLIIKLSGIYQKTEDKRIGYENIEVAYSPKHIGYIKCRYNMNDNISIALDGHYVGEMETFWDDMPDESSSYYSPTGRIGKRVGSNFCLGLNLRFENLFRKGIFINARVSNLFDSDIRYPAFSNNPYADKGTLGYGREFQLTFGWEF